MNNEQFSKTIGDMTLFIESPPPGFRDCLTALKKFSKENFKALYPEGNPITATISNFTASQLEFIIKEYSGFSNDAIHMLVDAMIRNHDWKQLYEEIQRNIDEEKGEETKGIPHLEMMRQGYKIDLGIETDLVEYSEVTIGFLKKMRKIFKNNDNAFSSGALLAFEGTAIAEFHILDAIVSEYKIKKKLNKDPDNATLTKIYIDGHKDFEIGHEAHLMESIEPFINKNNMDKMVRGYFTVCITMDLWWEQLALESFHRPFNEAASFSNIEDPSVSGVFGIKQ